MMIEDESQKPKYRSVIDETAAFNMVSIESRVKTSEVEARGDDGRDENKGATGSRKQKKNRGREGAKQQERETQELDN
jgi:hypothetical protein